ncbi:hypothetical protein GGF31_005362 [Allomyces arbusculus]|nr:hypothetical protein GGF31_005362 [Allomyces arbusculus]
MCHSLIVQIPENVKLILTDLDHFDKVYFEQGMEAAAQGRQPGIPSWMDDIPVGGTPARNLIKKLDAIAALGAIMDPAEWMQRMAPGALTPVALGVNIDSINHPDSRIVVTYNTLTAENADLGKLLMWSKDGMRMLALIEQIDRFIF